MSSEVDGSLSLSLLLEIEIREKIWYLKLTSKLLIMNTFVVLEEWRVQIYQLE